MNSHMFSRYRALVVALGSSLLFTLMPASAPGNTFVRMQTDLGGVDIELFDTASPNTVLNFLKYVDADYYNGTFISRRTDISEGFEVMQMGGLLFDPALGTFTSNLGIYHIPVDLTSTPLDLEPGLSNVRTTLAMARGSATNSATSEFFINLADNNVDDPLNGRYDLDTLNGGYTVFGQVVGGMNVIDEIATLQRCKDVGYVLPAPCNAYPTVPLVDIHTVNDDGAQFTTPILQQNLVNFLNIGTDVDGDGIIDKVEDAADPALQDKNDNTTASFTGNSGSTVTLHTSGGVTLFDTVVLGNTFFLTTQDPGNVLDQIVFIDSIFGTTLHNVALNGDVDVILPPASAPNAFFLYGPTPTDNQPHWYEFDYDGETGAQFSGDQVTLHFVDGKRGDSDLQVNGEIGKSPGAAARRPGDHDGVADAVEDGAPNGGDGNGDNVPDKDQDDVVSFPDDAGRYITLEVVQTGTPAVTLNGITYTPGEFYLATVIGGQIVVNPAVPAGLLDGVSVAHDFIGFDINGLTPGGSVEVRVILPAAERPVGFLKYGPTAADPTDHVYDFRYDGTTGAEFDRNVVTLHFVDGGKGDSDMTANGVIRDPGAVLLPAAPPDSGGGGCSILGRNASPWQAGAWWLLGLCLVPLAMHRVLRKSESA